VPDGTPLSKFRRLLETHKLGDPETHHIGSIRTRLRHRHAASRLPPSPTGARATAPEDDRGEE